MQQSVRAVWERLQQPLPTMFHLQVHDQPIHIYPTISIEEECNIMSAKVEPTIVVVGKVVSNKVVSGTRVDGTPFEYHKLTITTQNGNHWDTVKPRNGADKATLSVFATAKAGDLIAFSNCFLNTFVYKDAACVDILAGKATK
jgi:hypothetical protein